MIPSEPRPAEPDAAEESTIRSFHIDVPEEELVDLRRRIAATRWPEKETVADHVMIPSMPGYGFSGKPTSTGWGPERMGRAWATLMGRLGYDAYVAQGGHWGAFVVDQMAFRSLRP
jgi:hypothetical protein